MSDSLPGQASQKPFLDHSVSRPLESVSVDLCKSKGHALPWWPWTASLATHGWPRLTSKTTRAVIAIMEKWFCEFGWPKGWGVMVDPNSIKSLRSGVWPITSSLSCPLQGTLLQMVLRKQRSSKSNTSWRRLNGPSSFFVACWLFVILPCPMGGPCQHRPSSNRTYACLACPWCPPSQR
jgi:hypothetical protein